MAVEFMDVAEGGVLGEVLGVEGEEERAPCQTHICCYTAAWINIWGLGGPGTTGTPQPQKCKSCANRNPDATASAYCMV